MSGFIRLGSRKPVSTYGKFLIVQDSVGGYSFWDTEVDCEIAPSYLGENTPWNEIVIYDDAIVLTAFPKRLSLEKAVPTSGYERGINCVFLKSIGEFLVIPEGYCKCDMAFDKVQIEGDMICCTVTSHEKTTSEYWFDLAGNCLASKQHKQEDEFYTVKLRGEDEEIKNVCEVHPVKGVKSNTITGLYIIVLTKDNTDVNLFYPFK